MVEGSALPRFSGVIPPMISPLTDEKEVDQPAIARLVDYLIEGGVNGLFVLGTSGEGPRLTLQQNRQVIGATVRQAKGRVPVLAGVLQPSTHRTLEAVAIAEEAGADALVVTSPYYLTANGSV